MDDSVQCPRCGQVLKPAKMGEAAVRVCAGCKGTLLAQVELVRLLEAMSVELLKSFDPDTTIDPAHTPESPRTCPTCGQAMCRNDYCGAGLAHFDRCEGCALIWLDPDDLGTMTLMWARMERRIARTQAENRQYVSDADNLVYRTLVGRVVGRSLIRILG